MTFREIKKYLIFEPYYKRHYYLWKLLLLTQVTKTPGAGGVIALLMQAMEK